MSERVYLVSKAERELSDAQRNRRDPKFQAATAAGLGGGGMGLYGSLKHTGRIAEAEGRARRAGAGFLKQVGAGLKATPKKYHVATGVGLAGVVGQNVRGRQIARERRSV